MLCYPRQKFLYSKPALADSEGHWNVRPKDGGEYEFDLEAQDNLPLEKRISFSIDVPGHYTIVDESRYKGTEPPPPNTTPPSTVHGTELRTWSSPIAGPQEFQWIHNDNQRAAGLHTLSDPPSLDEVPAQIPYSQTKKKIFQPRPEYKIRFDLMNMFREEPKVSNPHGIRRVTTAEFLRHKQKVEERIKSKPNYRPPGQSPPYRPNQIQYTINGVAPRSPIAPQKPVKIPMKTPSLQQSQQHCFPWSLLTQTNPPTSYAAFLCLDHINIALHRIEFLNLGPRLDDVKNALRTARDCLRRQRTISHDIWKKRYDSWDLAFIWKIDALTRFDIDFSPYAAI
ncbi:hypothetical protein C0995_007847 [Termitomyces sp. Mi166|nr:hypothetical protein C0995_007847 [Termitomyces sp. Mi166\